VAWPKLKWREIIGGEMKAGGVSLVMKKSMAWLESSPRQAKIKLFEKHGERRKRSRKKTSKMKKPPRKRKRGVKKAKSVKEEKPNRNEVMTHQSQK